MTAARPRVAIIGTGGTIGSLGVNSLDYVEYTDRGSKIDVTELIARVPELAAAADIVPVSHATLSSSKLDPAAWLALSAAVHATAAASPPPDGIVITHGTSTLEESAYFLNLALKVALPVVVVGAQRPFNTLSSDAALNLLAAVRAAASPATRGLGVLVLLNDTFHAAREATKLSTNRVETFDSPSFGALGHVELDGSVAVYRRPSRRRMPDTEFDLRGRGDLPRVDIVYSYAGAGRTAIDALVAAGARGIVSAGFAPGLVTPEERAALEEARRKGVLVVQGSRAGSGRVLRRERFIRDGIVVADNLTPQKARILAMLALTVSDDPERVQAMFDEY